MSADDRNGLHLDLLSRVSVCADTVLAIGHGIESLGPAWTARQPSGRFIALDDSVRDAQVLGNAERQTLPGDLEQAQTWVRLGAILAGRRADVLVLDGVLERVEDPRSIMARLRSHIAPGGTCVACFSNVAHWQNVRLLLQGQWEDPDALPSEVRPRHRYTLDSIGRILASTGWTLLDATPRIANPQQTEAAVQKLLPIAQSLGLDPQQVRRDLSALQWVIRAVNGKAETPISVAALGLRKFAGVTEARVDHPLQALNSLPQVRAVWSSTQLQVPPGWPPGVFILHRQFMNHPAFNEAIERQIAKGWTVVADMDDDPHHWPAYPESGFRAFRGVHAVTVSTPALADMMRQWNPHVQVFPNAIPALPPIEQAVPKGPVPRIFFGALNRAGDWGPIRDELVSAAQALGQGAHWVVIHDRAFFDTLPADIPKTFHPTLPPQAYLAQLASCDISLLPLADTPFNRLKSDLKFIESCAAGAVPVCSPTVYAERPEHLEIGCFVLEPAQWRAALLRLAQDPTELARRRQLGLDYVRRERMMAQQAAPRLHFYRDLMARRPELEAQRQARLQELDRSRGV